jgi:hypothetical protein
MKSSIGVALLTIGTLLSPCTAEEKKAKTSQSGKKGSKGSEPKATDNNDSGLGLPRRTQGHKPHDANGDGVIDRKEWPGDDKSFEKLDRDRDGKISENDRSLEPGQPKPKQGR